MLPRLVDARGEELTRQAAIRFNKKKIRRLTLARRRT
jgi:hypothetical protein